MRAAVAAFLLAVLGAIPSGEAPDAHDDVWLTGCLSCHRSLPLESRPVTFSENLRSVCTGCHNDPHGSKDALLHPVDALPSMRVPADLPLDERGRLTCFTCHVFHGGHFPEERQYLLRRRSGRTFCYGCHTELQ